MGELASPEDCDLEERLHAQIIAAEQHWPSIPRLDRALFTRFLASKAAVVADDELEHLVFEDLYLVCACLEGHVEALKVLEKLFDDVARALERRDCAPDIAKEVTAQLREQMLVGEHRTLEQYTGRGRLTHWIRTSAVRRRMYLEQARGREVPVSEEVLSLIDESLARDPELCHLRERFRERCKVLFPAAFARLSARDKNLLLQHYADGLTTGALGALHRVHRVTISRWLTEARTALLEHFKELLQVEFALTPSECSSMIRAFRSQIEISIIGLVSDSLPPQADR